MALGKQFFFVCSLKTALNFQWTAAQTWKIARQIELEEFAAAFEASIMVKGDKTSLEIASVCKMASNYMGIIFAIKTLHGKQFK